MIKVKICGITSVEVCKLVLDKNPDAIGVYTDPGIGKNSATEVAACDIVKIANQRSVSTFLISDAVDAQTIKQEAVNVGCTHVQLREDVPPTELEILKNLMPSLQIVKVIGVTGPEAMQLADLYAPVCDELLLDSKVNGQRGGTGAVHDWDISKQIVEKYSNKAVWLAGGIKQENVVEAIKTVQPAGIDVETGVQNSDGTKNYDLISSLIGIVHESN